MSRTDKDRPYWVGESDPHQDRLAHHWCGASKVRINGRPMMIETSEWYAQRAIARGEDISLWVMEETRERRPYITDQGSFGYYSEIIRRYFRPGFETLWVTEYIECDLNTVPRTEDEYRKKNCTWMPLSTRYWATQSPGWWTRETVHVPRRRMDRDNLREAVKWHRADPENFAEDFDIGYGELHEPYYW